MTEKLQMIAAHEEQYGQISDEMKALLLQQKHLILKSMIEKLQMIAAHEKKYWQISDTLKILLLPLNHHIIQKKLDEWAEWAKAGGRVVWN